MAAGAIPLLRLAFDINSCFTADEVQANFKATLKRGYTPLNGLLDKYSGTCSLVGAGPSIEDTLGELQGDVIAINSAIPYLIERGIVPKWAMLWDAHPLVAKFVVPHPDITYLIASRCHPEVFALLEDCNVVVWHAAGDHDMADWVRDMAPEPYPAMVNGGTAGITRGIYLANCLGYRDMHIFGADSSYSMDGRTHIRGSVVPEKDTMVAIGTQPPLFFRTTPEWCQQVNEYKAIYALFTYKGHTNLTCHGQGMLQTMHHIMEAQRKAIGDDEFLKRMCAEHEQQMDMDKRASAGDDNIVPIKMEAKREATYGR